MLWFYLSALAVLVGAELNAEIEHASPYGKDPGEKVAGEKKIGRRRTNMDRAVAARSAAFAAECDVDGPAARRHRRGRAPATGSSAVLVLAQAALLAYVKLRSRFDKIAP